MPKLQTKEELVALLPETLERARLNRRAKCYCEANSYEHRGACNYCISFGYWNDVEKKAEALEELPIEEYYLALEEVLKLANHALSYYTFR